jgi:hypothetical protein
MYSVVENVGHLIKRAPNATKDDRVLLLLYWQLFDGIEIPREIAKKIITQGTRPESITRSKRKFYKKNSRGN